ncbi:thioesterase [Corynebacterium phocae]|uniref:Thioesterase n=1 Tax=Corynebacterium phocae TaxID=161895 RepID=A0A1L7D370_9CORY|nr:PaaI family thioesterase [Corynebacterium phocae]APT92550.1 thioesterase [Corynebacterium phocae]KAA8725152.1 PaaI family thioesterase [Corynebacterium phocae]
MKQANERQKLLQTLITVAASRPLNQAELAKLNELSTTGGFDATVGIRYTHLSAGEARAVIQVGPQHHQPWGVANGGVYCSLAESVASLAGVVAAGGPVMGINNNTNFISAVSTGAVEAVARPIQLGRRTQVWEVTMSQDGELKAKTTLRTMVG